MEYIDVAWSHHSSKDPVRLVSELNEARLELRKLEFFRDGSVGVAFAGGSTADTRLGIEPVPQLAEINADVQFSGVRIGAGDFEALWAEHGPGDA
jgi:hypothetical protein